MIDIFDFTSRNIEHRKQEIVNIAEQTIDLFDHASIQAFESLREKLHNLTIRSAELQKMVGNYTEENKGVPTMEDQRIMGEMMDLASDQYWTIEHLNALSEMKIVYLFKSLEITMKTLITTAYPKVNSKDFYKWETMSAYLKSIEIVISGFDGYNETTELRKVNNNIKHSNIITEEILRIREFAGKSEYNYIDIDNFHLRIKPKIENFIKQLGQAIIKELFVFDESRIDKIGDDLKLRMEAETLKKLAAKLIE